MALNAVPAKRGWQTRTQADGTTIEIQLIGDEFCHYMINRDGKRVRENEAGMYEVVGEAPTAAQFRARRAKAQARRQYKEVGVTPNLAPKGVVIIANFNDSKMQSAHTLAVFDELCNSANCTVNNGFPSAAQYFADQSNGSYRPQFDIFGPVNLTRDTKYYGADIGEEGNDQHAADAVVEACRLADAQFNINWADYDSDNDGFVDFVYLIYAGKGQADGGSKTTIWPHNWYISAAREYYADGDEQGEHGTIHYCTYTKEECTLDGKELDNYACSSELSGNALGGIGTLCHEFGHVMGLPDLYDTDYGQNYEDALTPGSWNIMDAGSYNGDGHCPPNYDPWEKYFFGWLTPENLGSVGRQLDIVANGQQGAKSYQINALGKQQKATEAGTSYYIENRQQQGWDKYVPGHGLLVWKITFNQKAWEENAPNLTATKGSPLYTVVSASGTEIGTDSNGAYNTFPGKGNKTHVTLISGKPLKDITEKNGVVSLVYIENLTSYPVSWVVNGAVLESREYAVDGSEDLVLPAKTFEPCEGTKFIGWTTHADWCDPFSAPDDLFTTASGKVTQPVTYYAVFE